MTSLIAIHPEAANPEVQVPEIQAPVVQAREALDKNPNQILP